MTHLTAVLLSTHELARELGVHPSTLAQWRRKGRGPAFMKLGKVIRYNSVEVAAWIYRNRVAPNPVSESEGGQLVLPPEATAGWMAWLDEQQNQVH
jgi:transposase-like protein